jgi:hypothetical protein
MLDHARLERRGTVRKFGIASAVFHDTKPHFLLVRYDPATPRRAVWSRTGVHANDRH